MITKQKECNGCQQQRHIFKNVTVDGMRLKLCKDCAYRQDLKAQPSKVQIKKVSEKKKQMDLIYTKLRKIQLEKFPLCQIQTDYCTSQSTEIHHAAGRLGDNYLKVNTWFAICRECHSWIHLNPKEARELEYLK